MIDDVIKKSRKIKPRKDIWSDECDKLLISVYKKGYDHIDTADVLTNIPDGEAEDFEVLREVFNTYKDKYSFRRRIEKRAKELGICDGN